MALKRREINMVKGRLLEQRNLTTLLGATIVTICVVVVGEKLAL